MSYLVKEEKEKLCLVIREILLKRGGCWITADIHLKNKEARLGLRFNDEIRAFNEQQHTEENSFESFEEAEKFFNDMGFIVEKEARVKYSEMSSFRYMIRSLTIRHLFKMRNSKKIQATWRLKAV